MQRGPLRETMKMFGQETAVSVGSSHSREAKHETTHFQPVASNSEREAASNFEQRREEQGSQLDNLKDINQRLQINTQWQNRKERVTIKHQTSFKSALRREGGSFDLRYDLQLTLTYEYFLDFFLFFSYLFLSVPVCIFGI